MLHSLFDPYSMFLKVEICLHWQLTLFQVPNSAERSWNDMMYKMLMLDDFSIYWDSDSKIYGNLKQTELIVCYLDL